MTVQLIPREVRWYGWKPDYPDQRDFQYKPALTKKQLAPQLGKTRNLARTKMPPVYDQGALGSCTANAIAGALQYQRRFERLPNVFMPSRLAIYYGEREIDNSIDYDAGAYIRDGMKVVAKQGAAPEELWPYDIGRFRERPPESYYPEAEKFQALVYERVEQTEFGLKAALWDGHPIVFGVSVYESFESSIVDQTGAVPTPKESETLLGGHAILMTGFSKTLVRFRNSWGDSWGKSGYGTMPLDYVLDPNLADDFWIIRDVED